MARRPPIGCDSRGSSTPRQGRNRVTILVVEDNAITRQIVRLSLAAEGYNIIEAEDGRTAISKMVDSHPDFVFTARPLSGFFPSWTDWKKPAPPKTFSGRLFLNPSNHPS